MPRKAPLRRWHWSKDPKRGTAVQICRGLAVQAEGTWSSEVQECLGLFKNQRAASLATRGWDERWVQGLWPLKGLWFLFTSSCQIVECFEHRCCIIWERKEEKRETSSFSSIHCSRYKTFAKCVCIEIKDGPSGAKSEATSSRNT